MELVELINQLPADKKKEVEKFVASLTDQSAKGKMLVYNPDNSNVDYSSKLKREFGSLKGFITFMADDFDAQLNDFKDYM